MRATRLIAFLSIAVPIAAPLAPARADDATLAVRDTQGLPPYTSNIRDRGVSCVRSGCVNDPSGSIDPGKTYEATVKAQSHPR